MYVVFVTNFFLINMFIYRNLWEKLANKKEIKITQNVPSAYGNFNMHFLKRFICFCLFVFGCTWSLLLYVDFL